jgi:hypothetical protein
MHGCLGASPPQIPHFGIFTHPLSTSLIVGKSVAGSNQRFCSERYIEDFFPSLVSFFIEISVFVASPTEESSYIGYLFM